MDALELKDTTHFLRDFGDFTVCHMCGTKKVRGLASILE